MTTERPSAVMSGESAREGAPRVLLVDDQWQALDVYADVLGRWGYEVRKASSYAEALAALEKNEFDVVLVELRMPDRTAYRLIEDIRNSGKRYPVIAMSRISSVGAVASAFRAGATDYIAKPFAAVEIRDRIQEALRGQRARSDHQAIVEVISAKALRLAELSSSIVGKAGNVLREFGLETELRSILDLSGELADLGAELSRVSVVPGRPEKSGEGDKLESTQRSAR